MSGVPVDDLRQRAARVAARSEVSDIRLFNAVANFIAVPADGEELSYRLNSQVSPQLVFEDGGLIVSGEYVVDVRATSVGKDGEVAPFEDRAEVATIEFTLAALFGLDLDDDEQPFSEDELDSFARTTGHFALHPYAREYVADTTGRMGLPQLHIGIMKIHLDAHEVKDAHPALAAPAE